MSGQVWYPLDGPLPDRQLDPPEDEPERDCDDYDPALEEQ